MKGGSSLSGKFRPGRRGELKIIDRPHLKSKGRLFLETAITFGFWGAYLYCLLPAAVAVVTDFYPGLASRPIGLGPFHAAAGDLLGGRLLQADLPATFIGLLIVTGRIALAAVLLYAAWICYNYVAFLIRGAEGTVRETKAPDIDPGPQGMEGHVQSQAPAPPLPGSARSGMEPGDPGAGYGASGA